MYKRQELISTLNKVFAAKDAQEWLDQIEDAGLPCGPINTVPDVFNHPQAQAREMIQRVEHPSAGQISLTGFPYKLSRTPAETRHVPPTLGEHTEEILIDLLDYSPAEVKEFGEKGII